MEATQSNSNVPVYERVVKIPLERVLFEDPTGIIQTMTGWKEDDPRRQYLNRIFHAANSKTIFLPCHLTPSHGCGRPASKILIPLSDGKISSTPRVVCDRKECLATVENRGRSSSEIYPLSFTGLVEFVKKHPDPKSGSMFLHWLSRALGLSRLVAVISDEGLKNFFGLA